MAYIPGEWWVLCDACQLKTHASKVSKRPTDGLLVHTDPAFGCWETRHPQEFVRSVKDNNVLPFIRPDREIEAEEVVNCDCHYVMQIPYLITENSIVNIYKGYTLAPAHIGEAIIEDGAEVIVHCEWIVEVA
jgi:hypothetical protein